MREFEFYGANEDGLHSLGEFLRTGNVVAYPLKPYDEPSVQFFDRIEPALLARIDRLPQVGLWVPSAARVPFRFEWWDTGELSGKYYVFDGGPAIGFRLPRTVNKGGTPHLTTAPLSCSSRYYDPDGRAELPVPRILMDVYPTHRRLGPRRWQPIFAMRTRSSRVGASLLDRGQAAIRSRGYFE